MSAFAELAAIVRQARERDPAPHSFGRGPVAAFLLFAAVAGGLAACGVPALVTAFLAAAAPILGWAYGLRCVGWSALAGVLAAAVVEPWQPVGTPLTLLARGMTALLTGTLAAALHAALNRASAAAETDRLTGLLNRAGFLSRLDAEANRARRCHWPLAVGFLDCDNFKQVNDQQGHLAGDEVLKLTAAAIADNVRNYDSAARFGGDEFVVLWPVLSAAGAEASGKRLHRVLSQAMTDAGYPVTFSIGVAVFEEIPEPAEVLDAADGLMYEVKAAGKGQVLTRVFRGAKSATA